MTREPNSYNKDGLFSDEVATGRLWKSSAWRPRYSEIGEGDAPMLAGLRAYLDSIRARDPAPRSNVEILLYPGVWALGYHRIAHALYNARLFFLARWVNHIARFFTAIDIHPGAKIGKFFFIDHGFTVIGGTAGRCDHVTICTCVQTGGD